MDNIRYCTVLLKVIYLFVEQWPKTAPNISIGCTFEINVLEYFNVGGMLAELVDVWCSQRLSP